MAAPAHDERWRVSRLVRRLLPASLRYRDCSFALLAPRIYPTQRNAMQSKSTSITNLYHHKTQGYQVVAVQIKSNDTPSLNKTPT
jgi:hypothetical protein